VNGARWYSVPTPFCFPKSTCLSFLQLEANAKACTWNTEPRQTSPKFRVPGYSEFVQHYHPIIRTIVIVGQCIIAWVWQRQALIACRRSIRARQLQSHKIRRPAWHEPTVTKIPRFRCTSEWHECFVPDVCSSRVRPLVCHRPRMMAAAAAGGIMPACCRAHLVEIDMLIGVVVGKLCASTEGLLVIWKRMYVPCLWRRLHCLMENGLETVLR